MTGCLVTIQNHSRPLRFLICCMIKIKKNKLSNKIFQIQLQNYTPTVLHHFPRISWVQPNKYTDSNNRAMYRIAKSAIPNGDPTR